MNTQSGIDIKEKKEPQKLSRVRSPSAGPPKKDSQMIEKPFQKRPSSAGLNRFEKPEKTKDLDPENGPSRNNSKKPPQSKSPKKDKDPAAIHLSPFYQKIVQKSLSQNFLTRQQRSNWANQECQKNLEIEKEPEETESRPQVLKVIKQPTPRLEKTPQMPKEEKKKLAEFSKNDLENMLDNLMQSAQQLQNGLEGNQS